VNGAGWAGWAGLAGSREVSYIFIKDKPRARLARVYFGFASIERASQPASERASARARWRTGAEVSYPDVLGSP